MMHPGRRSASGIQARGGMIVAETSCRACSGTDLILLPSPSASSSVISDGRIWPHPLKKLTCRHCGLVSHAVAPGRATVRQFYSADYDLGAVTGEAERQRAHVYSRLVMESLGRAAPPTSVLEIGCGAGLVLDHLAARWVDCTFVGMEAAPQLAHDRLSPRISIRHAFFEEVAQSAGRFDLIFAINVIEHALDPARFLEAVAGCLSPDGVAIIVCPAAAPPNLELLFVDHIHTLTPQALAEFASQARLELVRFHHPEVAIGDFQALVLQPSSSSKPKPRAQEPYGSLASAQVEYLSAWLELDEYVCGQLSAGARCSVAFGAGEAAALLRTYAPRAWDKLQALIVDDPLSARTLGKPVQRYVDWRSERPASILLATHPRSHQDLARRLQADGHRVITWQHLIPR